MFSACKCIYTVGWVVVVVVVVVVIVIKSLINSAALKKLRRAAGICHSVLQNRCTFRCRAKVAVDGDERRRLIGRLFQMSGPETAKFLRPMVVAVRCTHSLPEAADRRCRRHESPRLVENLSPPTLKVFL